MKASLLLTVTNLGDRCSYNLVKVWEVCAKFQALTMKDAEQISINCVWDFSFRNKTLYMDVALSTHHIWRLASVFWQQPASSSGIRSWFQEHLQEQHPAEGESLQLTSQGAPQTLGKPGMATGQTARRAWGMVQSKWIEPSLTSAHKLRSVHNLSAFLTLASLWENLPISLWFITKLEPRVSDLGRAPPTPSSNIGVKALGFLMYTFSPCFWTYAHKTVRACSFCCLSVLTQGLSCTSLRFLPWALNHCICGVLINWAGRNTWRSGNLQMRQLLLHRVQSALRLTTWLNTWKHMAVKHGTNSVTRKSFDVAINNYFMTCKKKQCHSLHTNTLK